jgi:hypothetical protein
MFHFQQRYSVGLLSKPTTEMKVSEKAKMRLNKYAKLLRRDAPSQGRPVEAKGLHHKTQGKQMVSEAELKSGSA